MPYSVLSGYDYSDYIYIANLVDELPLNMTSRLDLERIICTELAGVEKFRFEEDSGEVWLTAFVKFCSKEAAEEAIQILNGQEKIGAATVTSLLEQYSQLEDSIRSRYSGYCAFSFIIVEQVNLDIPQSDMISLFTNYGPVKIAKTASPMCIGYERFTEALIAKIDQNRWNNASAYISVKIFPRIKEQVLGFLKARMNHHVPNSDPNVLDPFCVCLICDRYVQPQTYQEIDVSKSNGKNVFSENQKPNEQRDATSESSGEGHPNTPLENKGNCKLNFDPNDYLFYLRIESKALANRNKQVLCDSSSSDTGISSDRSTRTANESENGNDTMDSPSDSLNGFISQISLNESEPSNLTLRNQNRLDSKNPEVEKGDCIEPPNPYACEENGSGAEGNNAELANGYVYPQWPYGYIYTNQLEENHGQCCCDSSTANHEYLYPCYNYSAETPYSNFSSSENPYSSFSSSENPCSSFSSSENPCSSFSSSEIEKNFKLYGMKMRSRNPDDDPKIILIPFAYYPGKENENAYWYSSTTKAKFATRNRPEFPMKCKSRTIFTQTVAQSKISVEVPVLNNKNFPTLQEVDSSSAALKSRFHSEKHAEDLVIVSPSDPLENKLKLDNGRTLRNQSSYNGMNKSARTRSTEFKGSHNFKHQESYQNRTLGSSCGIKLVFSNKSRSTARFANHVSNPEDSQTRNFTDRYPKVPPSQNRRNGRSTEYLAYKGSFRRTETPKLQ